MNPSLLSLSSSAPLSVTVVSIKLHGTLGSSPSINFRQLASLFIDVTSFAVNLQFRRDATFYLCGDVSRFIHKLCARCYTSDTVPLENAWFLLLGFKTSDGVYMDEAEFLLRQKLTYKVTTASTHRSEKGLKVEMGGSGYNQEHSRHFEVRIRFWWTTIPQLPYWICSATIRAQLRHH